MNARTDAIVTRLEGCTRVRERDRLMLQLIGLMACGRLNADDVETERDLRQLAYLAALSRNRVETGSDKLALFMKGAKAKLAALPVPEQTFTDPLQELFGAAFSIEPSKVRSEAEVHVRMAQSL